IETIRTLDVMITGLDQLDDYVSDKKELWYKFKEFVLQLKTIEGLACLYGSANYELIICVIIVSILLEKIEPRLRTIKVDVNLAVEEEFVLTLTDFIDRRSSLLLFENEHGQIAINEIAMIMSNLLGWDELEKESQILSHTKNARKVLVKQ